MRAVGSFLVILGVVAGCGTREAAFPGVKQVSITELGKETDHLIFFNYTGSDKDFHYFATAEGKRYKVPRSQWDNPRPFPLDGGMQLFITVRDGKLTVPDPKEMAGLSKEDLLHRPYKKNPP